MQPSFLIQCFPWDLEDEGIESVLARLAGELGVDGITVPAVSGDVARLRTVPGACGSIFRTRAAANFQPDAKHWSGTRIRLPAAAWMKSRNSLERIGRVCERERLSLRVSIGPLSGDSLADRFPFAQVVNCFGDRPGTVFCPSNPDVREFYSAAIRDLSENYPVSAVALIGLAGNHDATGWQNLHPIETEVWNPHWALLSWCFCAACSSRAGDSGVDVQAALRAARDEILRGLTLAGPRRTSLREILDEDAALSRYHEFRYQAVRSLLQVARSSTALRLIDWELDFTGELDFNGLLESCDAMALQLLRGGLTDRRHEAFPRDRLEAIQRTQPPEIADGPALVAALHEAAQAGFGAIELHSFGVAPDPCLDWVRQAIRYARRETGV